MLKNCQKSKKLQPKSKFLIFLYKRRIFLSFFTIIANIGQEKNWHLALKSYSQIWVKFKDTLKSTEQNTWFIRRLAERC